MPVWGSLDTWIARPLKWLSAELGIWPHAVSSLWLSSCRFQNRLRRVIHWPYSGQKPYCAQGDTVLIPESTHRLRDNDLISILDEFRVMSANKNKGQNVICRMSSMRANPSQNSLAFMTWIKYSEYFYWLNLSENLDFYFSMCCIMIGVKC